MTSDRLPPQANAEEQQEQQLEGQQQKVYRLKQFLLILHKDLEASSAAASAKRDDMRTKVSYLNDRYTFNTALSGNMGDDLFKAALTALLLMLNSDALAKESDVFKAATSWMNPMKREVWDALIALMKAPHCGLSYESHCARGMGQVPRGRDRLNECPSSRLECLPHQVWDKFHAAVRGLELEINEMRTKPEDWSKVKGLADHLAQNAKGHRFRTGSQLCMCLCEWIVATAGYHDLSTEMTAKKKQYDALKKELQGAQKELDEVLDRDEPPDGISPTLIKSVMKAAREAGASVRREQAVIA